MSGIETKVETIEVVLAPVDTTELHALGCRIGPSVIDAGVMEDEKKEILGTSPQPGREVAINYLINGNPVAVKYSVEDIQPPDSYIGKTTVVKIQGERQNGQFPRSYVRSAMQDRLNFLEEELRLATKEGLPADPLKTQIILLRESLTNSF